VPVSNATVVPMKELNGQSGELTAEIDFMGSEEFYVWLEFFVRTRKLLRTTCIRLAKCHCNMQVATRN
jgi:hypothetical protein